MEFLHAWRRAWYILLQQKYRSWVPRKHITTGVRFAMHWFISIYKSPVVGRIQPSCDQSEFAHWTSLNLQHISWNKLFLQRLSIHIVFKEKVVKLGIFSAVLRGESFKLNPPMDLNWLSSPPFPPPSPPKVPRSCIAAKQSEKWEDKYSE